MVKEKYPRTKRQVRGLRLGAGFYNKKEGNQKAEKDVQEREKRKNIALGPSIAVSKDFKLMTHIVAGYPSLKQSETLALAMADSGASLIEIQIPFSDPVADGQTIMRANARALKNKITVEDCFKLMEKLKQKVKIPLLFMTYYNIPFTYGLERFCHKAKESGCYGLIIPDIPFDEEKQEHYLSICKRYKLHAIQIISLLTPENRLKKIAKIASGFIYCVSRTGTTGESKNVQKNLDKNLKIIKKIIKVPLALGFGISTKQQIEYLRQKAEIMVIGSKILNIYNHAAKFEKMNEVNSFLSTLLN